jgi:hypothetical protein
MLKNYRVVAEAYDIMTCPRKRDPIVKLGSKEKKLWAK